MMPRARRAPIVARRALAALALASLACASAARAQPAPPAGIAFDQHLGARVALDAPFTDTDGRATTLGALLDGRPAVLVPGYYECPNLCSAVREALRASLARVDLAPDARYRVIAVSIDPVETPRDAMHARDALGGVQDPRPGVPVALPGWHFLTGSHAVTGALADTIGFRYVYDPALRQYAHPSGVVVVTPDGRVSRYFFGVDYPPAALRASLVAAAGDQVGSPVRALLLRCLHYDPAVGRYTNAVVAASRILGLACIVLLGAGCLRLRARERPAPGGGTP